MRTLPFAALSALVLLGCSSSKSDGSQPVNPYVPPPAHALVEPGIAREVFLVDGVTPDANPTLSSETPKQLNQVRVVRYRVDANPPKPARAIVVLMPGFLAGSQAFDGIARALVRRGANDPDGAIEAWAIDRRANLLEDTHGADVSEVGGDATWSRRYYVDGEEVEGKKFAGFLDGSDVPYESEWGMATTLGDLRAVMALVPAPERKSRVVLVGHSLGATIAEAYAAWDWTGSKGFDELAGLVLIDGVANRELDAASTFSKDIYEHGDPKATGLINVPGLDVVRKLQPYITLPLLGVTVGEQAERIAIAASFAAAAPRLSDDDLMNTFALMLGLKAAEIPKMTNRAAFGFAFDDQSSAISIAALSMGAATGGPLESYSAAFGSQVVHPTDPDASYDWKDYDQVTPHELSSLPEVARAFYEGPGLNFIEWYFPTRLVLDAQFVGSLSIEESDWRTSYGLRAQHGAEIDAPVLAFAAHLTADAKSGDGPATAKSYDKLGAMLAKVPIGPGRPLAGTPRSDPRAYRLIVDPTFTHVDPVMAHDVDAGKAWFDTLATFVKTNTTPGGVTIPAR
jgi:pimeloyl-ACP methyl ester carboxylesterase